MPDWKDRLKAILPPGMVRSQVLADAVFDLSARLARLERAVFEGEVPDECERTIGRHGKPSESSGDYEPSTDGLPGSPWERGET